MTLRVKIHERVVYIIQERIFGTSKLPKALQDGLVVLDPPTTTLRLRPP
jgi:hypothetical protein